MNRSNMKRFWGDKWEEFCRENAHLADEVGKEVEAYERVLAFVTWVERETWKRAGERIKYLSEESNDSNKVETAAILLSISKEFPALSKE